MEGVTGWRDELVRRCEAAGINVFAYRMLGGNDDNTLGIHLGGNSSVREDFPVKQCHIKTEGLSGDEDRSVIAWIISTFNVIEIGTTQSLNRGRRPRKYLPMVKAICDTGYKGFVGFCSPFEYSDVADAIAAVPRDMSHLYIIFNNSLDDTSCLSAVPADFKGRLVISGVGTPGAIAEALKVLPLPNICLRTCDITPHTKVMKALAANNNLRSLEFGNCRVYFPNKPHKHQLVCTNTGRVLGNLFNNLSLVDLQIF